MKKVLLVLLCLITLCTLTGCESSPKDKKLLFEALKKEKIIPKSIELIDDYYYSYWNLEWCSEDYYNVYKDKDSKIIIIQYKRVLDEKEYKHIVTVYPNVTLNKNISTIKKEDADCENGYYKYSNDEYTADDKYNINYEQAQKYYAYEKKTIFGKKYYSLEQEKEN